jgi:peptidoglycan-associated lipoprotein
MQEVNMHRLIPLLLCALPLVGSCHKAKRTATATVVQKKEIPAVSGTPINSKESSGELAVSTNKPSVGETAPAPDEVPGGFAPVYFAFDDSDLSRDAMFELDALGEYLSEHPQVSVVVAGHTDERGTDEYNLALSAARAAAVKDYLARLRIDPARISTIPYGEEMPAAQGATEEAWSLNRRAEFSLVEGRASR